VATGRVLPTISEDCVTVSAQVVSSTRIVQRDLSDEIARALEIASRECEKNEDDAYNTYDDHDDDGNDDTCVEDLESEPAPDVNVFCHSFSKSLDCGECACDDEDDDGSHDDKDEHNDNDKDNNKDDTIYEVVKKKRSRTKHGVVLPVRRSTRLAERRLRQKLQDHENNDSNTSTGMALQADVLGSTVLNGRRRSARLLTNKTHSGNLSHSIRSP
jgi:hypothetical protein